MKCTIASSNRRWRGSADGPPREGETGTYNEFWDDHGTKAVSTRRSSLIIDPPDGRIPPLTEAAQKLIAERAEIRREHGLDGPEYRPINERCLWRASTGPPIFPVGYNNNYRITQTPGYAMILSEMIHDARIIPLDGRQHAGQNIRQWLGDSVGHFEGDTLVVDTTNYSPESFFRGSRENLHVVERFTRVSPNRLDYEITLNDPTTWVKPWTLMIPLKHSDEEVYEYACHEANEAMVGILAGARAQEKQAAKK